MSAERISELMTRARDIASTPSAGSAEATAKREKLAGIAAEFESMLLGQMLREMRNAGKWDSDDDDEGGGFGMNADALFQTIDVELASRLSKTGAFGLGPQLLKSFERNFPGVAKTPAIEERVQPPAPIAHQPAVNPVALKTVTSEFGWRRDPLNGAQRFHKGVDLRAAYGEDVKATAQGRVVFEGVQGGYGTTVVLEHENGIRTRYAHLSASEVTEGQTVDAGQVIGRAGRSGRATAPHLHFEVMADGRPIDPSQWMPGAAAGLKVGQQVADLRVGETGHPDSRGETHEN